jgi:phosphatidylglycerol:prolipoprotein diacylglycerol transferase
MSNPDKLWSLQFEGLTSFGGLIFGAVFMISFARAKRIPLITLLDAAAPAMLLSYAIGRVGCFLNGCCEGGQCPTGFPLGVRFPGHENEPPVHPAQLYETAMTLVALGVILALEKQGKFVRGQVLSMFLVLHGLTRFAYEFFRVGISAEYLGPLPITQAQAFTILLICSGLVLYLYFGRHRPQETPAP